MTRIYDRLRREKVNHEIHDMPVIIVDEVHEALPREYRKVAFKAQDYSNLAPLFDNFWMEARSRSTPFAWAIWFRVNPEIREIGGIRLAGSEGFMSIPEDTHWQVFLNVWIGTKKDMRMIPTMNIVHIAKDGHWCDGKIWIKTSAEVLEDPNFNQEFATHGINGSLYCAFRALDIIHCKNVVLVDEPPPEKLSKRHEKKHGIPLTTVKVLHIHSTQKEYETDGNGQQGSKRLLRSHIARGHFKTYTEDAPLFGKITGTYWWMPYLRGSKGKGKVDKRYYVHADKDD